MNASFRSVQFAETMRQGGVVDEPPRFLQRPSHALVDGREGEDLSAFLGDTSRGGLSIPSVVEAAATPDEEATSDENGKNHQVHVEHLLVG